MSQRQIGRGVYLSEAQKPFYPDSRSFLYPLIIHSVMQMFLYPDVLPPVLQLYNSS